MSPQALDSLVKLSHSSSATLCGRSQHGRQQHCELVRRVQASLTRAVTERLRRNRREQVPRQQEQEPLGPEPEEGVQLQAVDSSGARLDEEPHGQARCASNCSGSALPSPRAPPSTLPAKDPPSSRADGTPHHLRVRGDLSSHHDRWGEQSSEIADGNAVENRGGVVTTHAPGGARENGGETGGGQATGGVTADPPGPSTSQQARTGPVPWAQSGEPGHQWWRTPPAATKQRPEQA
ncbi:unnamed protein product [Closterium sp. Naga37s-1]|nr:unnamed protein product [Closterium sp. Naga37s-1]